MENLFEALDNLSWKKLKRIMKELGYDPEETQIWATCDTCGEQQVANADEGIDFVCPECGGTKFRLEFLEEEKDIDEEEDDEDEPIIARGIECFYMKAYEQRKIAEHQRKKNRTPSNGLPKTDE